MSKEKTIQVGINETISTFVSRISVTLNVADYPELDGMNDDEIKDYIKSNAWEMASPEDWADSLADYLSQMDVAHEKNIDEGKEIYFH